MLLTAKELDKEQPVELISTFMGAHALPPAYKQDREAYIRLLIDEMLPRVKAEGLAEYCDVFCETGVFTPEESRKILEAAKNWDLV